MNRKNFLCLTCMAAAGCQSPSAGPSTPARSSRAVDAGPADKYTAEGVYENFKGQGFYLVRRGGHLTALASVCTHRVCDLAVEPDHSFYCDCHGSTFAADGRVTHGPAVRDLPTFPIHTDARGHLMVNVATV